MSTVPEALRAALADRYVLERELGRGGMATVFLAHDARHLRPVAVKVFRDDVSRTIGTERFLREIQIAAQLQHPHILTLIDSGESGGYLYFVMPFVAGDNLRGLLDRLGALEPARIVGLVTEIADALDYAHRRRLVHRDIKPENILLSEGHAVVADFGIAAAVTRASGPRLTRTGVPIGTPGYMSPEQAAGVPDPGPRSDVYSLGVLAYEMAVGELPGRWLTDEASRLGTFVGAPPVHRARLDRLPGGAEQALVKAMAVSESERFAGPLELARAFAGAFGQRPRYDDAGVRAIVERAADLQAREESAPALTLGGVARIAAEVGIPADHVRRAADELASAPAPGPVARYSIIAGRTGPTAIERVVPGDVSPSAFPSLVQEMAVTMGDQGLSSTLGRELRWRMVGRGGMPRDVSVTVSPEGGRTRITIAEKNDDIRDGWGLAVGGGAGAMGSLAAIGIAGSLGSVAAGLVAAAAWLGGCLLAARAGFRWHKRERRQQLDELADRLTRQIGVLTGSSPHFPGPADRIPPPAAPVRTPT